MHDVALAFVWHQHQPYYPDDVGGENPMPWVRLHATKDYWGMAMQLKEVPEMHATINLVPSLLVQLHGLHRPRRTKTSTCACRGCRPTALTEADMNYLLDNFFMVHPDQMIRPYRALPRAVSEARPVDRFGRPRGQAIHEARHPRPAMLVEPDVDPSAGVRAGQATWPSFATRDSTGPRTKSSGCSSKQMELLARSFRCIANWPSAARSS